MNIGDTIKTLKKSKRLTYDMLSFRSGISIRDLKKIISGTLSPTDIQLKQIAIALGVAVDALKKIK